MTYLETLSPDSTDYLWQTTHAALMAGKWSKARELLERLGRRSDVVDELLPVTTYARAAGVELHPTFVTVLQDRIDQINWRIEHRSEGY